jgi:hypothetical protein
MIPVNPVTGKRSAASRSRSLSAIETGRHGPGVPHLEAALDAPRRRSDRAGPLDADRRAQRQAAQLAGMQASGGDNRCPKIELFSPSGLASTSRLNVVSRRLEDSSLALMSRSACDAPLRHRPHNVVDRQSAGQADGAQ